MSLNRTDIAILRILQADARTSNVSLAEQIGLSEAACLRRVRALETAGLVDSYVALLNPAAVGLPGTVFVEVTLHQEQEKDLEAFERAVRGVPEVMECYLMTGDFDYLVKVVIKDLDDFERVHRQVLTRLPGVSRIQSSVALRAVKRETALPIA